MKNLTWQNPEQLFVAQELINKVKSKCCGIKAFFTAGGKLVQHSEKWSTEKFSKSDVCPKLSAYHKNARFHGNKSVKTLKTNAFALIFQ